MPRLVGGEHHFEISCTRTKGMLKLFTAALVLLLNAGTVSAGIFKQHYENGNLMAELSMSGFTMQGLSKTYYESGKLMSEMNYKDGEQDGLSKEYYESGKLKAETNYTKDKPVGVGKEFYEAGQIMQEIHYANGSPQTKKVFYENGKIRQEWNYRVTGPEDLAVVTSYNPDGSPAGEKIVKKPKPKQRKKKLHTSDAFPEKAGALR